MHQTGHGLGAGQIGADLSQHPLLGTGKAKRQDGQKFLHQALATRGQSQGWSRSQAQLAAPLGQAQLQQQKLIKNQAAAACLQLLLAAGPMDLGKRFGAAHQLLAATQGLRQGIWPATH